MDSLLKAALPGLTQLCQVHEEEAADDAVPKAQYGAEGEEGDHLHGQGTPREMPKPVLRVSASCCNDAKKPH